MFFIERRQTRRFFLLRGRCILCAAGECENRATELLIISPAWLLAGFVDVIAGGGGLVLVSALIAVFPTTRPATLFGVNTGALVGAFVK